MLQARVDGRLLLFPLCCVCFQLEDFIWSLNLHFATPCVVCHWRARCKWVFRKPLGWYILNTWSHSWGWQLQFSIFPSDCGLRCWVTIFLLPPQPPFASTLLCNSPGCKVGGFCFPCFGSAPGLKVGWFQFVFQFAFYGSAMPFVIDNLARKGVFRKPLGWHILNTWGHSWGWQFQFSLFPSDFC